MGRSTATACCPRSRSSGTTRCQSHALPPPPWISANVATIRERSGQRCHDGLAKPRVQLAMPATVYAELHNPQSGLRQQRSVELVQLGQDPRRDVDAQRMVLDGDLGRQVRDRTPLARSTGSETCSCVISHRYPTVESWRSRIPKIEDQEGNCDRDDAVAEDNDPFDTCLSFMCHLLAQPFVRSTSSVGNGKVPESAKAYDEPADEASQIPPSPSYHTTVAAHCSAAVPGRTKVTLTWNAPVETDDDVDSRSLHRMVR